MTRLGRGGILAPMMLLLLSAVPVLGGIARLVSLTAPPTAADVRFFAAPIPVVLHIFSATVYAVLGAFQFSSGFRSRWPGWHRRAGRVVAFCGLSTALAGVWMTARYTIPPDLQGPILYYARLLVGATMTVGILLALSSVARRDFVRHEAWMIRAYALAQGAGTQALVLSGWLVLSGEAVGITRDLLMTLAWVFNLALAEWIIRARSRRASVVAPQLTLRPSRA